MPMNKKMFSLSLAALLLSAPVAQADQYALYNLIDQYAAAHDLPADLVHRVVKRESNYNPRAVGRAGALGLMQIKHATARGMGYAGSASGLLDAETNLAYAVPYLAGAYRAARGNVSQAIAYYASGYYYVAKRMGLAKAAPQNVPVGFTSAKAGASEVETTGAVETERPAAPLITTDR
jgi:soluble lytic murein transglycosylase-like protein